MECINLTDYVIKILGIYFSYDKKIKQEKNLLNNIAKIQNILQFWKFGDLTIEGRTVAFKLLAILKLIHPSRHTTSQGRLLMVLLCSRHPAP